MNAKEEFLNFIKNQKILCASISYQHSWDKKLNSKHILPVNYTKEQYNIFINSLDFKYDNGFGGQELFGTIWFKNNTWADRGEYDGSEWWQHFKYPKIPKTLNPIKIII